MASVFLSCASNLMCSSKGIQRSLHIIANLLSHEEHYLKENLLAKMV